MGQCLVDSELTLCSVFLTTDVPVERKDVLVVENYRNLIVKRNLRGIGPERLGWLTFFACSKVVHYTVARV